MKEILKLLWCRLAHEGQRIRINKTNLRVYTYYDVVCNKCGMADVDMVRK